MIGYKAKIVSRCECVTLRLGKKRPDLNDTESETSLLKAFLIVTHVRP